MKTNRCHRIRSACWWTPLSALVVVYENHVYGENELGGTAWLYLSGRPMTELGLLAFDERPIPSYTEPLQHAIFKNFIPPISLFSLMGSIMWLFKNRDDSNNESQGAKNERT